MSGLIPEDHIRYLLEKVDIVDVIGPRIGLKKKGFNYFACCPFHKEKTPSFTVNTAKQFFHCFGCGVSGDAIKFLMDFDNLSFVEVVTNLTHSLGLEMPSAKADTNLAVNNIAIALELAAKFFENSLRDHQISLTAVNYLKQRNISGKIAKQFRVGFAPDAWDSLKKNLAVHVPQEAALQAGLLSVSSKGDRVFDKFRNRIMFAIRDKNGQVIGFGGRVLSANDEPKYLNSPETAVFSKGHELYGLFEAKQAIRSEKSVIIVEGYLDVISLSQHSISNCVATLGTSCTEFHLEKIFKLTENIIFCFDGDKAGRQASIKALELILPMLDATKNVKFLILDYQDDPDSLINKIGVDNFKHKLNTALSVFEFIKESLSWTCNLQTLDGKFVLANRAKELIKLVRDQLLAQMMLNQLAQELGVENQILSPNSKTKFANNKIKPKVSSIVPRSPIKKLLALMIKFTGLRTQLPNFNDEIVNDEIKLLYAVQKLLLASDDLSLAQIKQLLPPDLSNYFNINEVQIITSLIPDEGMQHEFDGCIKLMERVLVDSQVESLLNKARFQELSEVDKVLLQKLLIDN
jgi:DNA primase